MTVTLVILVIFDNLKNGQPNGEFDRRKSTFFVQIFFASKPEKMVRVVYPMFCDCVASLIFVFVYFLKHIVSYFNDFSEKSWVFQLQKYGQWYSLYDCQVLVTKY